jgi:hypothetical protein
MDGKIQFAARFCDCIHDLLFHLHDLPGFAILPNRQHIPQLQVYGVQIEVGRDEIITFDLFLDIRVPYNTG